METTRLPGFTFVAIGGAVAGLMLSFVIVAVALTAWGVGELSPGPPGEAAEARGIATVMALFGAAAFLLISLIPTALWVVTAATAGRALYRRSPGLLQGAAYGLACAIPAELVVLYVMPLHFPAVHLDLRPWLAATTALTALVAGSVVGRAFRQA